MKGFVAKEAPDPDSNVLAEYLIESSLSTIEAAARIAAEESIGTWTEVTTTTERIKKRLGAKVFKVEDNRAFIAFPVELFDFDTGGLPNVLSIVAGNLFGLSALKAVRLLDVTFPPSVLERFKGPRFGIKGVRKIVGTLKNPRPHVGTIVKPKVGLNPKQMAKVAYEAAVGGVDLVKDDETLANQSFCPIFDRLSTVMDALDRAKEETGRVVFYALNVTSEFDSILKIAEEAVERGANMIMIDVLTTGLSALKALARDPSIKVPLHVHRAMHGAFTRVKKHGIHMKVIAKLVRMAGGDQLHTGIAAGKMEHEISDVLRVNDALKAKMGELKSVMPVASGGIHPGLVPANIKKLGIDLVINAGGGIHGHPRGTRAGAAAMRQAVDAVMKDLSLKEYAKTHEELRLALEKWGYEEPR